jgi:nucleoside 2-deoxyribosyltransferase
MSEKGFFAYGSQFASSGECIEEAIEQINSTGEVYITSWIQLRNSGRFIINEVLDEIDSSDFFCCDLTGLNDNVLFELGYALAKKKPVYVINDVSFEESDKKFKELNLLSTIGYTKYSKTHDIVNGFFKERPYDPIGNLWTDLTKTIISEKDSKAILVLNSQTETNYNLEIINQVDYFKLPKIVDDASENVNLPLNWYIQKLHSVPAVLIQFSSQTRSGFELHNSKCALVAGMALGLGLNIQLMAEKPYTSPLDFRDLLKKFSNRPECAEIVKDYLINLQKEIATLLINERERIDSRKKLSELQNLDFGEAIAEHESNKLYQYYVDTSHTQQLIKNEYNIVVGRKGTGKTATLYYLFEDLVQDKRNNVVLIKPINFEVDGLIALMEESNSEFEKGFLIETVWKFLIYSQIAKTLYDKIKEKPLFAITDDENKYIEFIESNKSVFLTDFSTRLEEQIKKLRENEISKIGAGNNNEFRMKVSEILHEGVINEMKDFFGILIPKNHKLIVLIDNLDKSWKKDARLNILSRYILGLLGVSGRIFKELSYIKSIQTSISFHLTIFLRSDIFKYIQLVAREPDKMEVSRLMWDDSEILFRIIEERFVELSNNKYERSELFSRFFTSEVKNMPTKDFIINSIFPRPRDLIYFCKSCKDIAVSRGHENIQETDVLFAYKEYSSWIFKSLLVENNIVSKQMEDFLFELVGGNNIIDENAIKKFMTNAEISIVAEDDVEKFIDNLVDLTILGREVKVNEFEFEYDVEKFKKIKVMAKKLDSKRYKIHNALLPFLECDVVL